MVTTRDMRPDQDPLGDILRAHGCVTRDGGTWRCSSGCQQAIIPQTILDQRSWLGRLFDNTPKVPAIICNGRTAEDRNTPKEIQVYNAQYLPLCEKIAEAMEERFECDIEVRLFREQSRTADSPGVDY